MADKPTYANPKVVKPPVDITPKVVKAKEIKKRAKALEEVK